MSKLKFTTNLFFLFFLGCNSNVVPVKNPTSAIVFVPGFYGSELVSQDTNEKIWLTLSQMLFGGESLMMPFPELRLGKYRKLRPGGILDTIGVVPLLYSYSIYQPTMDYLKQKFGGMHLVDAFTYDWREDPVLVLQEFEKYLVALKTRGIKDITVVSHSLGGYLMAYFMRYGAQDPLGAKENWSGVENIQNFIIVTAPYRGSGYIFRNLHYGRPVGINKKLLPSTAFVTFPISYYFLPQLQLDFLVDADVHVFRDRVSDPRSWQKNGWGLFAPEISQTEDASGSIAKSRFEFTANYLQKGKKFMELVLTAMSTPPRKNVNLLSVIAESESTINQIKILGFGKVEDPMDGDSKLRAMGDGTLTIKTQELPEGYRGLNSTRVIKVNSGHLEALGANEFKRALEKIVSKD